MKYDEFAEQILRLYPESRYVTMDRDGETYLHRDKPECRMLIGEWWYTGYREIPQPEGLTDVPEWQDSLRPVEPKLQSYPVTSDGEVWRCREYNVVQIQGLVGYIGIRSPDGVMYNGMDDILCNEDLPVDLTGWKVLFR